jgi:hypothetical protein
MSVALMSEVWRLELTHAHQSVALALADHGDDDGSNIYPGIEYIAWKTGYSERNVIRILEQLEAIKLIRKVGERGIGKGNRQGYKMSVENVPLKPPMPRPKHDKPSRYSALKDDTESPYRKGDNLSKGDRSDTQKVTSQTPKGDNSDTLKNEHIKIARPFEPSVNHQLEPSEVLSRETNSEKSSKPASLPRQPNSAKQIEAIYQAYPRHVAKPKALAAISAALKRIESGKDSPPNAEVWPPPNAARWLHDRAALFATSDKGNDGEYTPHPATWFNNARYIDDEKEWSKKSNGAIQPPNNHVGTRLPHTRAARRDVAAIGHDEVEREYHERFGAQGHGVSR